ncbi:MAG: flagellar biosynthetic protein FliO [Vicinamibacteraceae bacterium]|nr:flagellar biosynthetic protein FliO [Vicinamibacteraceae bacterium]
MTRVWFALQQTPAPAWPSGDDFSVVRAIVSIVVVASLLGVFVWLARRGVFGGAPRRQRPAGLAVEGALPLGERRSLVVVTVEGRRLLLGLTPVQVTLVTELAPSQGAFDRALSGQLAPPEGRP